MSEKIERNEKGVRNRRVHMANERTFLAWMRTSIGLMAFGFVVERFALFVRQLSHFIKGAGPEFSVPQARMGHGYSAALGIFLVAFGIVLGILAFYRYRSVERQIEEDTYHPSYILSYLITFAVLVIGIGLIGYLVYTI